MEHWLSFLNDIFEGDKNKIEILRSCISNKKRMIFIGPSRSGKGTVKFIVGDITGRSDLVSDWNFKPDNTKESVVFELSKSFLGKEDPELLLKLRKELPLIKEWVKL